jgi:hypothetical protein
MLIPRFAFFVPASKKGRLSGALAFQLLDSLLQLRNKFAELLVLSPKSGVLSLEFFEALVARVGFHAILPSRRSMTAAQEACTVDNLRASKPLL